jgi:hypothetical protein
LRLDKRLSRGDSNRLVGVYLAIAAYVKHGLPAFSEDATDKQSSVAMRGVFLAAEQSYTESLDSSLETGDGCFEIGVVA